MSHLPPEQRKEKGRAQSCKIRAASFNHAIANNNGLPDYKTISGYKLPEKVSSVARGYIERQMLSMVYQHPYINTHQIQEALNISNAAQHSKSLNERLMLLGYRIAKYSLRGHRRVWQWVLQQEVIKNEP